MKMKRNNSVNEYILRTNTIFDGKESKKWLNSAASCVGARVGATVWRGLFGTGGGGRWEWEFKFKYFLNTYVTDFFQTFN